MNSHHPNKYQPDCPADIHDEAAALRLLGLAVRAGKAAIGRQAAIQALKRQNACLVWLAKDASDDTREKISRWAVTGSVKIVIAADKHQLGQWSGRETCAVAVLLDQSFSKRISQLLDKGLAANAKI